MLLFFSTKYVKEKIKSNTITENQVLAYFFLTVIYDSFYHSLAASRTDEVANTILYQFTAWSFLVCTVFIWAVCFFVNGGLKGTNLLVRFFPLSITVGYKYAAFGMLTEALSNSYLANKPVWFDPLLIYTVNILMAANIAYHIRSIRGVNT